MQKLITKTANLPPLYANEKVKDPMVRVKLFTPWTGWTWLLTEYDPHQNLAFGFCYNRAAPDCAELGYISITELEAVRGPAGLRIEREIHWKPKPLSQAKAQECPHC